MQFKSKTEEGRIQEAYDYLNIERKPAERSHLPEPLARYFQSVEDLTVVKQAQNRFANGGTDWVPNYHSREAKWYPWPLVQCSAEVPAGSGFAVSITGYGDTNTNVGSRQFVKTEELVEQLYELFPELLKVVLLG